MLTAQTAIKALEAFTSEVLVTINEPPRGAYSISYPYIFAGAKAQVTLTYDFAPKKEVENED